MKILIVVLLIAATPSFGADKVIFLRSWGGPYETTATQYVVKDSGDNVEWNVILVESLYSVIVEGVDILGNQFYARIEAERPLDVIGGQQDKLYYLDASCNDGPYVEDYAIPSEGLFQTLLPATTFTYVSENTGSPWTVSSG